MSHVVITEQVELDVISCGECHIPFALPQALHAKAKKTGARFFCPNGHNIGYSDTEVDRLKKQLLQKQTEHEQALAKAQDEKLRADRNFQNYMTTQKSLDASERRVSAAKGQITKVKNRVHNGVCPCCNRHFTNLERHMKGQHPDWKNDDQSTSRKVA